MHRLGQERDGWPYGKRAPQGGKDSSIKACTCLVWAGMGDLLDGKKRVLLLVDH